jgi:ATP-dependent Clp protease protease subunit
MKKNGINEEENDEVYGEVILDEKILEKLGINVNDQIDSSSISALFDIEERMKNRRVYLFGDICTYNILVVIHQIHILENRDPESEIELYINSAGGYVIDCLALIDVMDASPCDFRVVVLGMAASAACLIASNGTPGKRYAGRNSEFMFHEVSGPVPDMRMSDIQYIKKETKRVQDKFNRIFSRNTGISITNMKKDFYVDKDRYLTATEARKYNIVDHVLIPRRNN